VGDGNPWWLRCERWLARGLKVTDEWIPPCLKIVEYLKSAQTCKFKTDALHCSKNTQTLHEARFEYLEQLSQLAQLQISNRIRVIYFGIDSNLNF
jgi:hypothetical protein